MVEGRERRRYIGNAKKVEGSIRFGKIPARDERKKNGKRKNGDEENEDKY